MKALTPETLWETEIINGTYTFERFRQINNLPRREFHEVVRYNLFMTVDGKKVPQPRVMEFLRKRGGNTWGIKVGSDKEFIKRFGLAIRRAALIRKEIKWT